jgi:hypothetical protein
MGHLSLESGQAVHCYRAGGLKRLRRASVPATIFIHHAHIKPGSRSIVEDNSTVNDQYRTSSIAATILSAAVCLYTYAYVPPGRRFQTPTLLGQVATPNSAL